MSTWQFDSINLTILNTYHGTWTIDLKKVTNQEDLLFWILQAAQHGFDMPALFDTFRKAINHHFSTNHANGAIALKELYDVQPYGSGTVIWH